MKVKIISKNEFCAKFKPGHLFIPQDVWDEIFDKVVDAKAVKDTHRDVIEIPGGWYINKWCYTIVEK